MSYKVLYIVAAEIGLKDKGLSGRLTLENDQIVIAGPMELSIPLSAIETLRIFRQHKVGTFIHIHCPQTSVFLTVPRFNFFGVVAVVNLFKTRELLAKLDQVTKTESQQS
jgi:hypothetical protein